MKKINKDQHQLSGSAVFIYHRSAPVTTNGESQKHEGEVALARFHCWATQSQNRQLQVVTNRKEQSALMLHGQPERLVLDNGTELNLFETQPQDLLVLLDSHSPQQFKHIQGDFQLIYYRATDNLMLMMCGSQSGQAIQFYDDGWQIASFLAESDHAVFSENWLMHAGLEGRFNNHCAAQVDTGKALWVDANGPVLTRTLGYDEPDQAIQILALVTEAFGGYGGIQQANRDLSLAMSDSEKVSSICMLSRLGQSQNPGEKISQLVPRSGKTAYAMAVIRQAWVGRRQHGFIFCGHLRLLSLAWLAALISRKKIWLHLHGIEAWDQPGAITQWLSSRAKLVTCVSRYTRKKFLSWSALGAAQVKVLPNRAKDVFKPAAVDDGWREQFSIDDEDLILTVARLGAGERLKGHDLLLEAFANVLNKKPQTRLVIVGSGVARQTLEAQVQAMGIQRQVSFTGRISDPMLVQAYRHAKVFVLPSRKEGFGIVFLEALLCGCPVIGFGEDGSRDPLHDGLLGTISSAQTLTQDLLLLLDQPVDPSLASLADHYFNSKDYTEQVSVLMRSLNPNYV